jgi:hypothetical protein
MTIMLNENRTMTFLGSFVLFCSSRSSYVADTDKEESIIRSVSHLELSQQPCAWCPFQSFIFLAS